MVKRILAIIAIFMCTCVAWMILGTSIFLRTESAGNLLSGRVASAWGSAQEQHPPAVSYLRPEQKLVEVVDGQRRVPFLGSRADDAEAHVHKTRGCGGAHPSYFVTLPNS